MKKRSASEQNELRKMLSAVFMLCMSKGSMSEMVFERLVINARRDAKKRLNDMQFGRLNSIDTVLLGSVLHRWYRNPRYLDLDSKPLPIRAAGRAPSVQALFREEKGGRDFPAGLEYLKKQGIVRLSKSGFCVPRTDTVMIHTLTPELVANVSMAINRLVTTLFQNTSTSRLTALRLIERNAIVLDLPTSQSREFKKFSREQGAALISTINDWLEHRKLGDRKPPKTSRRRTVTAGVHVFAFCDEN